MNTLIVIGLFITLVLLIEGSYFVLRSLFNPERRRLRHLSAGSSQRPEVEIVRKQTLSQIPWLHRILCKMPTMHTLARLLEQGNISYPLGVFLLLSIVMAGGCFLLGLA